MRSGIGNFALIVLAALLALWLILGFWPLSGITAAAMCLLVLLVAGLMLWRQSRQRDVEIAVADDRLPPEDFRGAVVLVCGDSAALFSGNQPRETAQGWYLPVDAPEQLAAMADCITTQRPALLPQVSLLLAVVPEQHTSAEHFTSHYHGWQRALLQCRRVLKCASPLWTACWISHPNHETDWFSITPGQSALQACIAGNDTQPLFEWFREQPSRLMQMQWLDSLLMWQEKHLTPLTQSKLCRAGICLTPVTAQPDNLWAQHLILSRRRKNNPILVGEPGVGKTALVEGLALRIAEGNVPDSLKPVSVHTLDLGMLQAGAGVKGEFEQRLKNIITEVQNAPNPVLLFIDEAHTIIGAGNAAGGADAANLLKPALARGELRTIAATTWSEYKQYFEKDAALERRFQMVKVDEPDDDTACLMLRGLKSRYAEHHGVHITDAAVRAAVTLSRRYLTGRQLPDKAVDLLDTAAARVRMSQDTVPEAITRLRAKLDALNIEQRAILDDEALGGAVPQERLADIATLIASTDEELESLEQRYAEVQSRMQQLLEGRKDASQKHTIAQLQSELDALQPGEPLLTADVDARIVAGVIADWTGVPLSSLMKDEQAELLTLENQLATRVVGQDAALNAIAQRLRASKTGLTSENGPQGVFLLVGTSGTGKTETALALADLLYGGEKSLITINLSEYQEAHTVSQLKGSPPGYVGYGQGGILTEAVRKRPYSVVLLDEVEKGHRDVINLFYQVFDRGFMRDGEGREIDFRNTVILMTSNLGSDALMQLLEEMPEAAESDLQECLRPILRDHFQPALLARFQTVIYRPLAREAMRIIVEMKLSQVSKRLQRHYGIRTTIGEGLYEMLTDACLLPDTGARNVDSLLNQQILPVLSQMILQHRASGTLSNNLTLDTNEEGEVSFIF